MASCLHLTATRHMSQSRGQERRDPCPLCLSVFNLFVLTMLIKNAACFTLLFCVKSWQKWCLYDHLISWWNKQRCPCQLFVSSSECLLFFSLCTPHCWLGISACDLCVNVYNFNSQVYFHTTGRIKSRIKMGNDYYEGKGNGIDPLHK